MASHLVVGIRGRDIIDMYAQDCTRSVLTGVDPHVSVPSRSVIQGLATNGALFPFLRVAHPSRGNFLHVIVQLELDKRSSSKGVFI